MSRPWKKRSKRGRNDAGPRFIQLDYWIMETWAFGQLSGEDVKVLLYLLKRYNGHNNGEIGFGVRSGCFVPARRGTVDLVDRPAASKTTVANSLKNLERLGFIRCTKASAFDHKRLTREWRLTWLRCKDELPTKEFLSVTALDCDGPKTKPSPSGGTIASLTVPLAGQPPSGFNPKWLLQSHGRAYAPVS